MDPHIKIAPIEFARRLIARRAIPILQRLGNRGAPIAPKMAVIPRDLIGSSVIAEGIYERDDIALLRQVLLEHGTGGVMLDVGANIGNHTLALADLFDRVICYEPHPVTRLLLEANIALGKIENATVRPLALGESEENGFLNDVDTHTLGSARISQAIGRNGHRITMKRGDVDLVNTLAASEKIRFVKLDVEGFESKAIRGLTHHLQTHHPLVAFEALDSAAISDVMGVLRANGYQRYFRICSGPQRNRFTRFVARVLFGYTVRLIELDDASAGYASLILALPSSDTSQRTKTQ